MKHSPLKVWESSSMEEKRCEGAEVVRKEQNVVSDSVNLECSVRMRLIVTDAVETLQS